LSDTNVCELQIRACLGSAARFCEVQGLRSTISNLVSPLKRAIARVYWASALNSLYGIPGLIEREVEGVLRGFWD